MHLGWLSNPRTSLSSVDGTGSPNPFELSVIDLVTSSGRLMAWIVSNGRRTSDWLNEGHTLRVRGSQRIEMDDTQAVPPPTPTGSEEQQIEAADVLFVIPPPLPANRHLRLHRRRVHVELQLNGFVISGQAHVRPGAEVGRHIFQSGRRFVPLTDVELVSTGEPTFSWSLPVVIINSGHVQEIRGVTMAQPIEESAAELVDEELADTEVTDEMPVSRNAILVTALELLLEAGVIGLVEFQEKRAVLLKG
ncbi:MAG: hypothetical protein M3R05_05800 [Chloroflexota bacterium]|nr:hypothetical protein [Chloroflexota bacterium]